jgi:IS5 family transposase
MQPKKQNENPDLFRSRLDQIVNMKHELIVLAQRIDWSYFEKEFGAFYVEKKGRPGKPIRLMVGLHYLKQAFDVSDEAVVLGFLENPYWQYFCGYEHFQKAFPIDPSSLTRFRKRLGAQGIEALLKELLNTAKRSGELKKSHLNKVNVDTTVQEKAITFPTDAKLYFKMRALLVKAAGERGIDLRQNYNKLAKKSLSRQSGYARARQFKRARKMTRQIKTFLGRVHRDIERKAVVPDGELQQLLGLSSRLQAQQKESKNKIYSLHAQEVECISKGKAHKRYEFGCKVGLVTSSRDNWILGIQAFHGNPYDGHTLKDSLSQVKKLTGWSAKEVYVDLGYRGHAITGETKVHVVNFRTMARKVRSVKRWFKRRSAIEPVIGHLKQDNGMQRNYLQGEEGDKINALLSACGFNMRKLLKVFLWPKWIRVFFQNKQTENANLQFFFV